MRILFAAPITFDRVTFFISQYFVGLVKAARTLGHEVRLVQTPDNVYSHRISRLLAREFKTLRRYAKPLVDLPLDLLLSALVKNEVRAFRPDLLYMHVIDTSYISFAVNSIRKQGVKVATWWGVHPSMASLGVQRFFRSIDFTFIYDSAYIPLYLEHDVTNVHVVPLGCDISYFDSINVDDAFRRLNAVDVCFVGIFDRHRESYLNALTDFNLGIWSWNIKDYDTPLTKYHRGTVYGEELIKVFQSSKIVVNIHRDFEVSGGNYRLFEIPASRSFQLVDEKTDMARYFELGKEVVTFQTVQDLKEKVRYYLDHPEERADIAHAGYERVKKDHTLRDRMRQMLALVERS